MVENHFNHKESVLGYVFVDKSVTTNSCRVLVLIPSVSTSNQSLLAQMSRNGIHRKILIDSGVGYLSGGNSFDLLIPWQLLLMYSTFSFP